MDKLPPTVFEYIRIALFIAFSAVAGACLPSAIKEVGTGIAMMLFLICLCLIWIALHAK